MKGVISIVALKDYPFKAHAVSFCAKYLCKKINIIVPDIATITEASFIPKIVNTFNKKFINHTTS